MVIFSFIVHFIFLQGLCTLINITVNVPVWAKRLISTVLFGHDIRCLSPNLVASVCVGGIRWDVFQIEFLGIFVFGYGILPFLLINASVC